MNTIPGLPMHDLVFDEDFLHGWYEKNVRAATWMQSNVFEKKSPSVFLVA